MTQQEREKDAAECRSKIATANRARAFLDSEFWNQDLRPMLEKEQDDAKTQCLWAPGGAVSVDQVAMKVSYLSGASAGMERILLRINDLVQRGDEAEKDLKRLEERK